MRVDPKTLLLIEMTDFEAASALEWAENLVLAGTFPPDDPPWLAEWLRVAGYDERQRLMLISTAIPQRILLSVVRHFSGSVSLTKSLELLRTLSREELREMVRSEVAKGDFRDIAVDKLLREKAELLLERDDLRRALCEADASNPGEGMVSVPGDPDNDPISYAASRWGAEEALRLFPVSEPLDPHSHPLLAELAKIAVELTPQERLDLELLCAVPPGSSTFVESGPNLVGKDLARRASPLGSNRVAYEAIPRGRLLVLLPR